MVGGSRTAPAGASPAALLSLMTFEEAAEGLVAIGRAFDARGWAPATSGNYSARLDDGRVAITVLIYPDLTSDGIAAYAVGGTVDAKVVARPVS